MWDKLVDASPYATMNTNVPSTTTAHPPISHISSTKHTHSAPSTTSCKYYITVKKVPHLNTKEKFHIYAEYINGSHLNDEHTIFPNNIFDSLIKPGSSRTPP
jgi:hypothetical protein